MAEERKNGIRWLPAVFMDNFGLNRILAVAASVAIVLIVALAVVWFFQSAPPRVITITSGPPGSSFERAALWYRTNLAQSGVTVNILNSQGSQENLRRLADPSSRVDVGFVQSGSSNILSAAEYERVDSLGSVAYQPLLIFYRGPTRGLLSQFKGQKLVIGPPGSGTRALAMTLLETNGLSSNLVSLVDLDPAAAAQGLRDGSLDALFLMGDSATPAVMRDLLHDTNISLFDFSQADAYTRRLPFLNKLMFPKGAIDFGRNVPSHDVTLIGPTVDLLARKKLHPALCDLVLEAAGLYHGKPSLMQRKNEFPAALEHDFPLSAEAARFYKTGKSFTYRYLPFRLASLVNRFVVAFVPMLVVLIPGMRLIPALLRLRMRIRLFRWYRALMAIDRDLLAGADISRRDELSARLDEIETVVNKMKVPASFADQFYVLRQHIDFVRARLPARAEA
ncbi:MAG TPA: TAXI family TRAP transporter solute-binding subunit [Verrucomicrobiae bacterium]|jgi:TRAP-type uncharacterized transport system substrate-binding protein|nr:TAXI family TRAP transporter solute-binding subunit [Verrucomicrobiae bacterium]